MTRCNIADYGSLIAPSNSRQIADMAVATDLILDNLHSGDEYHVNG